MLLELGIMPMFVVTVVIVAQPDVLMVVLVVILPMVHVIQVVIMQHVIMIMVMYYVQFASHAIG